MLPVFLAHASLDDVDVKISVARMTVTYRLESVSRSDFLDPFDHRGKLRARNYRVFLFIDGIGFHRMGQGVPDFPEGLFFRSAFSDKHLIASVLFQYAGYLFSVEIGCASCRERVEI